MSIVAALKKNGQIWMIADRQITWGSTVRVDFHNYSKITRFKNAFIGHTGLCIYGTALSYLAETNPELYQTPFETKWDVLNFFFHYHDFVKNRFALGGSSENEVSRLKNSEFLVVTQDTIFEVADNRDVTEFNNFAAIGSGARVTLGAIHALDGLLTSPAEILPKAYQSCCELDNYCGGEIELIHVTGELSGKAALTAKQHDKQKGNVNVVLKKSASPRKKRASQK